MNKRNSEDQTVSPACMEPLVQLWLLRLLVPLEGFKKGFGPDSSYPDSFDEELLASLAQIFAMDIESCMGRDECGYMEFFNHGKALSVLHHLYTRAEKTLKHSTAPVCLARNAQRLSELAGLSATDCRILEFAVLIHTEEVLEKTGDLLGDLSRKRLYQALSLTLGLPQADVRNALDKNGALYRLGARLRRSNFNLGKPPPKKKLWNLLFEIKGEWVMVSNFPKFLGFEDYKDLFRSEALADKSMERKLENILESLEEERQR